MSTMRKRDERGMVSFLITMIMMIVISLIVIGFTQVANRNRRETLDRQLSTQAFYAAESGVNDAINTIKSAAGSIPAQNSCAGTDYPSANLNGTAVRYTCVLVDPLPTSIVTTATQTSSTIVPIHTTDASGGDVQADKLTFEWTQTPNAVHDRTTCPVNAGDFPVNAATCTYPLLRVDLFKVDGLGLFDPASMNGQTVTFYFQPIDQNGANNFTLNDYNTKANIIGVKGCDSAGVCSADVALPAPARSVQFYARLSTLYADAGSVTVTAKRGGTDIHFKDAQAVVDVTGKAQDVLRRVQVRVPLKQFAENGNAAVYSSGDVCKRFSVYSGSLTHECN